MASPDRGALRPRSGALIPRVDVFVTIDLKVRRCEMNSSTFTLHYRTLPFEPNSGPASNYRRARVGACMTSVVEQGSRVCGCVRMRMPTIDTTERGQTFQNDCLECVSVTASILYALPIVVTRTLS